MPNKLKTAEIKEYVNANIGKFHEAKLKSLKTLNLEKILKKKNVSFSHKEHNARF